MYKVFETFYLSTKIVYLKIKISEIVIANFNLEELTEKVMRINRRHFTWPDLRFRLHWSKRVRMHDFSAQNAYNLLKFFYKQLFILLVKLKYVCIFLISRLNWSIISVSHVSRIRIQSEWPVGQSTSKKKINALFSVGGIRTHVKLFHWLYWARGRTLNSLTWLPN